VLAIVGLSMTVAEAGGALGTPAELNKFFACQAINGANLGATLGLEDPATGAIIPLSVGSPVLLCQQVVVRDSAGTALESPDGATDVKCYNVNAQTSTTRRDVQLNDAIYPGGETVRVLSPVRLVCAPALQLTE
jgi:hypothetical protein